MGPTCCVLNCKYKINKASGKTVHRFPLNHPDILSKWLNNIGREGWHPTKCSIICSDHFEKRCFHPENKHRLKRDAVPTLFNGSSEPAKVSTPKKLSTADVFVDKRQKIIQNKLKQAKVKNNLFRKKLKSKQQKIRRLQKQVTSLNETIDNLKDDLATSEDVESILEKSFSGVPLDLLLRMLKNKNARSNFTKESYPPSIRTFAVTLNLYSSLAYDYVRSIFNSALPHPSALRAWYSSVVDKLGFSKEDFRLIKEGPDYCHEQESSENEQENSDYVEENPEYLHENNEHLQEHSEILQESSENLQESSDNLPEQSETLQENPRPNFAILSELIDYLRN